MIFRKKKYEGYEIIPKPFSCSLCMTFWSGLACIIATGNITIYYMMVVALMAFFTEITANTLVFIKDMINGFYYRETEKMFKK